MPKSKQMSLPIDSSAELPPSFNLWTEKWITLERTDGAMEQHSIEYTLLHAHEFLAIYDTSPLVIVGIHRLLTAILQDALDDSYLQDEDDLRELWSSGCFPADKLREFAQSYVDRFDLFSPDKPFMQSGDLPISSSDIEKTRSVATLFAEIPSGTETIHYVHAIEDEHVMSPAMAARGLLCMPCFTSSGGSYWEPNLTGKGGKRVGYAPSINGVPPIYVLPGGGTLFESLAASLLLPMFRPSMASKKHNNGWWKRESRIERNKEIGEVDYLHSLTFPARRIRLLPEQINTTCTRSDQFCEWGVRYLIFEMGERRPKTASWWQDPFVAYRLPERKKDEIKPIRVSRTKATWREFSALFLQPTIQKQTVRPRILDQIAELELVTKWLNFPFRCIGICTKADAKKFDWIDFGFDIPSSLLNDQKGAEYVNKALKFANTCERILALVFRQAFGGSAKVERYLTLKTRMSDEYWSELAGLFRRFILEMGDHTKQSVIYQRWLDAVIEKALAAFARAADAVGDDAASLQKRTLGEQRCEIKLKARRKKELPNE